MICAVLVIVPGDGVAWSQCKNPGQDIAAFQHRLDVFDFVRISCGYNDVLLKVEWHKSRQARRYCCMTA